MKNKRIAAVDIGDVYVVPKVVTEKRETATTWTLVFDDGSVLEFDKAADPTLAIEDA